MVALQRLLEVSKSRSIDQWRVNGCSREAKSRLIDLSRPRERSNDSSKLASIDPCLVDLLSLERHFGRFFPPPTERINSLRPLFYVDGGYSRNFFGKIV